MEVEHRYSVSGGRGLAEFVSYLIAIGAREYRIAEWGTSRVCQ